MGEFKWQLEATQTGGILGFVSLLCGMMLVGFAMVSWVRSNRTQAVLSVIGSLLSISVFTGLRHLFPLICFVQVLWLSVLFYRQSFSRIVPRKWWLLLGLRCAAILLVFSALYKPALLILAGKGDNKPVLSILVDRSDSMLIKDKGEAADRFQQSLGQLGKVSPRLQSFFDVRWYRFAARTERVSRFEELTETPVGSFDTQTTNLAAAIASARLGTDSSSLAGALVISDGNYTRPEYTSLIARELGAAVFCAGVGGTVEQSNAKANIEIESVDAPFEAPLNTATPITVKLSAAGLDSNPVQIQLIDTANNEILDTQTVNFEPAAAHTVRLQYTPKTPQAPKVPDIRKLQILASTQAPETNIQNNSADLHIRVTNPTLRVLYIEGAMRPEYKFLKRTLESDPNIQFASLIRWSENRFSAYGELDGKKVLSLPTGDADFSLFNVLIIGDIDRTFLEAGSSERLGRIKQFVYDGGALLMLGGLKSLGPGGYSATPIEDILPVRVGPRTIRQENAPFIPKLTAEGQRHPIFDGITLFFPSPGKKADIEIPPLQGCVAVQRAKDTAQVLMVHPDRANEFGPLVVLAVNPVVGKGRCGVLTCDTTWQWYMQAREHQTPYNRFWGQLIRWLGQIATRDESEKSYVIARVKRKFIRAEQPAEISAKTNRDDITLAAKLVNMNIKNAPSRQITLTPEKTTTVWGGSVSIDNPGEYRIEVLAVENGSKKVLASNAIELMVHKPSAELEHTAINESALKYLADSTGGKYAHIEHLDALADNLVRMAANQPRPAIVASRYQLYNFPLVLMGVVCLVTAEWILRRRWMLS